MEPVDVGILSLLPPIIAISLALVTKEVISSLMLGILSGGLIYAAASGGGLVAMSSAAFEIMSKTVGTPDKFNIILFLALLGALVCVVNKAGGSQAYGQWATRKITSRRPEVFCGFSMRRSDTEPERNISYGSRPAAFSAS